jgi:hypothetical protein
MGKKKVLWFKAKHYGWGWYPTTWQGWLVIFVYLAAVTLLTLITRRYAENGSDFYFFLVLPIIGLSTLLLAVAYKTGEKPGWRWGKRR